MKRFLKIELCFFVIGVAAGLGLFVALISNISWSLLGNVPGTPVELTERYPYIHVRTSDDLVYICEYHYKSITPCQPADMVIEGEHVLKGACGDPTPVIVLPETVASLSFRVCTIHEEDTYDLHIAALENGTIQAARRKVGSPLGPYFLGGLGGFAGLILGLCYYGIMSYFRPDPETKSKNDFKQI